MLHVVDFRTSAGDTGEPNSDSIEPYNNGESADQTVFRRPVEHNRLRVESLRQLIREHILLKDYNDVDPTLIGGGTITPTVGGTGMSFTISSNLYVVPFGTPGGGASTPWVTSTKATLSVGTGVNELVFTSVQKQFEGATFPEADANKISVEILDGGVGASLTVTVEGAAGEANNIKIVIDASLHTLNQVIAAVAGHATAPNFVVASLGTSAVGTNLCPTFGPAEWGTDLTARFLRGGAPGVAHEITPGGLSTFFGTANNELKQGDTLAIYYDKVLNTATTGGRAQSTPENTNLNVDAALFNTRVEPEKIPNSIPICKRAEGSDLFFTNGAIITNGIPATLKYDSYLLARAETGLLGSPLGWDRMGTGTDHNPPTTIRQALNNADGHIDNILDEIEAARTNGFETPAGSHLDLEGRLDRLGDHSTMGGTILSVGFDGGGAVGFDEMYMGTSGLIDAINAIKAFATYRVGGTIQLWGGDTLRSYQVGATFPVIDKPIHFTSPGMARFRNNRGLGASQYVFDFAAGADGSSMENITIQEDTSPSNKALRLTGVKNITIRNCHFIGRVLLSACERVSFENCTFAGGTNTGGTESNAVEVSGIGASACRSISFRNCRFTVTNTTVTTSEVVKISPSTSEVLDEQTQGALLENCYIDVPNGLDGLFVENNGGVTTQNVMFKCRPYTAGKAILRISNGGGVYNNLKFRLANWSGNYIISSFIKASSTYGLQLHSVHIDAQQAFLGVYAAGDNPLNLAGYGLLVTNLTYFGILLPDSVDQGFNLDNTRPLVLLTPESIGGAGGEVLFRDSKIYGIFSSPSASGTTNGVIIGTTAHNTTPGIVVIDNVEIDGGLLTYATASTYMVKQLPRGSIIRNCNFHDGRWLSVIHSEEDEIQILDNHFDFQSFSPQIGSAIYMPCFTAGSKRGIRINGNKVIHADTLSRVIYIEDGGVSTQDDGQCNNNHIWNVENNTPQAGIYLGGMDNWTVIGNVVFSAGGKIQYNNPTNVVPSSANIGTLNAIL
jgi:hypothetical protein